MPIRDHSSHNLQILHLWKLEAIALSRLLKHEKDLPLEMHQCFHCNSLRSWEFWRWEIAGVRQNQKTFHRNPQNWILFGQSAKFIQILFASRVFLFPRKPNGRQARRICTEELAGTMSEHGGPATTSPPSFSFIPISIRWKKPERETTSCAKDTLMS